MSGSNGWCRIVIAVFMVGIGIATYVLTGRWEVVGGIEALTAVLYFAAIELPEMGDWS